MEKSNSNFAEMVRTITYVALLAVDYLSIGLMQMPNRHVDCF
jgi:hypothetical protein